MTTENDDKNTAMMDRFLDAALPKLTEAMGDQIGKMLDEKTSKILASHTKAMDQLKDSQRENEALKADLEKAKAAPTRAQAYDTSDDARLKDPRNVVLTRSQARDTPVYVDARRKAAEQGGVVVMVEDDAA